MLCGNMKKVILSTWLEFLVPVLKFKPAVTETVKVTVTIGEPPQKLLIQKLVSDRLPSSKLLWSTVLMFYVLIHMYQP